MLVAALGCGGDEPQPTASGTWQGAIGSQVLTGTLAQDGNGNVTGTGTITNTSTGTRALTITGAISISSTSSSTNISLTFSAGGTTTPFNLAGTVSTPAIVGKLNGSGFADDAIVLKRQ